MVALAQGYSPFSRSIFVRDRHDCAGWFDEKDGLDEQAIISALLGVAFVGAFLVVASSQVLPYLKRVITPTVSGVVVLMIGLSLIKVGIIDFGGGLPAKGDGSFGSYQNLGLGFLVLCVVIGFNCCQNALLRMGGSPLA